MNLPPQLSKEGFSFYNGPIQNTTPLKTVTCEEAVDLIRSEEYMARIEAMRVESHPDKKKLLKEKLDYMTFGGIFSHRAKSGLIEPSGLMCQDIDNLTPEEMKKKMTLILSDKYTHAAFISPSGSGIKVIVRIPPNESEYEYRFMSYATKLGNKADSHTNDISRACFLSYDANAYYNPDSEVYDIIIPETTKVINPKKPVDASRSGKEFGQLCKLITAGIKKCNLDKDWIFNEMMFFSKWKEGSEAYRESTWQAAQKKVEENKNKKKESFEQAISNIAGRREAAENLWKQHSFFYDENKMFWAWNKEEYCYKYIDETGLLNIIYHAFSNRYDTIDSKTKGEIIESLKQVGREHIPKPIGKWWIQFKSKIIDIYSGEKFEATPAYFFTTSIPWEIGTSEETPKIDQYLKEWVVNKDIGQDESYVQTMIEILSYCTLNNQFLQTIVALTGVGSNGKGTFRNLLKKFIGKKNYCSSTMKKLSEGGFETSALYRKAICVVPEVDTYDMKNTSMIKQLSGEDPIRYEMKGKTPFTEDSITKIMILTNSMPITPDSSDAFYRRFLIIDFPHIFDPGKDILADIPDNEYNNLALKSIRILKELKEKMKFTNGGTFAERKKRYEDRSNPVEKYVTEYCILEEPTIPIATLVFCKKINEYLKENGLKSMKNHEITRVLRSMEIRTGGKTIRDGEAIMYLSGVWLRWKEDFQANLEPFVMGCNGITRS